MRLQLGWLLLLPFTWACTIPLQSPLYSRSAAPPPGLTGRTVAVLPPFGVGVEKGTAIIGSRAAEAIFSSDLGGVAFHGPTDSFRTLVESGASLEAFREPLTRRLPVDLEPEGKQKGVFNGATAASTPLGGDVSVSYRAGPAPQSTLTPEYLPRELLTPFGTDYVLTAVTFTTYRQNTFFAALLGVIPILWGKQLDANNPRAVFTLYESSDGKRVWEALVAVEGFRPQQAKYHEGTVDLRAMPFVGAAYLLTGDVETPLARVVTGSRDE